MSASIIEQAEHTFLGIEFYVGMSSRHRWVRSRRVVSERHVIFSCKPPGRVDHFHETSQVNALLLQAKAVAARQTP